MKINENQASTGGEGQWSHKSCVSAAALQIVFVTMFIKYRTSYIRSPAEETPAEPMVTFSLYLDVLGACTALILPAVPTYYLSDDAVWSKKVSHRYISPLVESSKDSEIFHGIGLKVLSNISALKQFINTLNTQQPQNARLGNALKCNLKFQGMGSSQGSN